MSGIDIMSIPHVSATRSVNIGLGNVDAIKHQAITWANVDPDLSCCMMYGVTWPRLFKHVYSQISQNILISYLNLTAQGLRTHIHSLIVLMNYSFLTITLLIKD